MNNVNNISKTQRVAMLHAFNAEPSFRALGDELDKAPSAAVVANGLLSFVKGVSKRTRRDVQNAYLYATMIADQKHGGHGEGEKWYIAFCQVMTMAGWVVQHNSFRAFNATERHFSMDKIALEILKGTVITAAMGASGAVGVMQSAREALDAIKTDKEAVHLFDRSAMKDRGANFGIGSVVEEDDNVCMALGLVQYKGKASSTTVLFSTWDSADLEIYQANTVFWMDDEAVEDSRDAIRELIKEIRTRKLKEFSLIPARG